MSWTAIFGNKNIRNIETLIRKKRMTKIKILTEFKQSTNKSATTCKNEEKPRESLLKNTKNGQIYVSLAKIKRFVRHKAPIF